MANDDDETLMRRIARGDEQAFRLIADRHLGRMLRLAGKMLGSAADADDVAQEALIRLWSHARSWRPDRSKLTTWLYTIVYRLCLDRLRLPASAPLDVGCEIEDPAPSALDGLAQASDLRRLAAALAALPDRQRAALTLFYYEELSGPEAAEIMGLRLQAFWSLLHRGRLAVQLSMEAS